LDWEWTGERRGRGGRKGGEEHIDPVECKGPVLRSGMKKEKKGNKLTEKFKNGALEA